MRIGGGSERSFVIVLPTRGERSHIASEGRRGTLNSLAEQPTFAERYGAARRNRPRERQRAPRVAKGPSVRLVVMRVKRLVTWTFSCLEVRRNAPVRAASSASTCYRWTIEFRSRARRRRAQLRRSCSVAEGSGRTPP